MDETLRKIAGGGLGTLFEGMFEGVQILDSEFRYVYLNEAAARHGERPREELLGRRMPEMYPGIEKTEVFGVIEACLRERTPQRMQNQFAYPDGRSRWFDLRMAPVPSGVLILSVDITEQKEREEELREALARRAEAEKRKEELVVMLAHELRNPLAPILNGLHLLEEGAAAKDPTAVETIRAMERELARLVRMVDQVLEATQLERGEVTLASERLDLGRLARKAVDRAGEAFRGRGVELRLDAPEAPLWIRGDDDRIAQALDLVLDNARAFTPSGRSVRVAVARGADGTTAELLVADEGEGIAPEDLPRVFESLFQADRSLARSRGGLGMGLALVKGIVDLHGGEIRVESPGVGKGTTVRIGFALESEPAALVGEPGAPPGGAPSDGDGQPGGRGRVLVIDDNRLAADTLAMILTSWGFEVKTAYTGPDGVEVAREIPPDIVLCDIGLPGLDGYGVAQALREVPETRSARMIAITGYGRDADRKQALEAGFDLHLVKPVDPEYLRKRLVA